VKLGAIWVTQLRQEALHDVPHPANDLYATKRGQTESDGANHPRLPRSTMATVIAAKDDRKPMKAFRNEGAFCGAS
jgi:hypothetical protein